MLTLPVKSKVIGAKPDAEAPSDIFLSLLEETITVAELIARTVDEQIRDLLLMRRVDAERAMAILNRQYLTDADIRAQAAQGAVKLPVHPDQQQTIDVEKAIRKAQDAFERGVYLIVVDGVQAESLDQTLHLHATSRANFVRLMPLVGG